MQKKSLKSQIQRFLPDYVKQMCVMKTLIWPSITESDKWGVDHAYKNSNQNNSAR